MWVLIIKLRSATSAESKQYRKAAKALLVLIPLLGVGYMLVLVTPTHSTAKTVFQYMQATLVSTQGFTVAVLYCFCNGEVRNSVRNHFQRFRLRRTLRYGGDYPATQSTYYRSTAYHPNGHRGSYAFRATKPGANRNGVASGFGEGTTNGHGNRNGSIVSGTGVGGMNANAGNNTGRVGERYSNSSDSGAVRMYRASCRSDKGRDSCISFTTTNSFLGYSTSGNGGGMGTPANGRSSINSAVLTSPIELDTEPSTPTLKDAGGMRMMVMVPPPLPLTTPATTIRMVTGSMMVPNGSGYHSIPSSPDGEIDLELDNDDGDGDEEEDVGLVFGDYFRRRSNTDYSSRNGKSSSSSVTAANGGGQEGESLMSKDNKMSNSLMVMPAYRNGTCKGSKGRKGDIEMQPI